MTSGIGNPDWQRRYTVSATAIMDLSYSDSTGQISPVMDTNGYQYMLLSIDGTASSANMYAQMQWYRDAAGAQAHGITDFTTTPGTFLGVKIPVPVRYFRVYLLPVGGTGGNTLQATVYGTNADQENTLLQNTAIPLLHAEPTIAAGATDIEVMQGIFGGTVNLFIADNGNALWTGSVQFYDYQSQSWATFWKGFGSQLGQAANQQINLPYAPIRVEVTNNDTASHGFFIALVGP